MLSTEMRRIYKRLAILGLLLACVLVFTASNEVETVNAARCEQECTNSESACVDSCTTSCDDESTPEECDACWNNCQNRLISCMRGAISCTDVPERPSECQFHYGNICPYGSGPNCTGGSAGYYMICSTIGGQQCVNCPGSNSCIGSGLPACP